MAKKSTSKKVSSKPGKAPTKRAPRGSTAKPKPVNWPVTVLVQKPGSVDRVPVVCDENRYDALVTRFGEANVTIEE